VLKNKNFNKKDTNTQQKHVPIVIQICNLPKIKEETKTSYKINYKID